MFTTDTATVDTEITMTSTKRSTWQRSAVNSLLDDTDEFLTASQIHDALKLDGARVGLATVYRAVQAMSESGELDTIRTADGEAAYRRCSSGHHHHLVCRECGKTVEIAAEAVESWADEVAARYGFTNAGHELEIFGECRNCAEPSASGS